MKIPFLRHFNPITQFFAAYTLYFLGGLITYFIVIILTRSIWGMGIEQLEALPQDSPVTTDINRIYVLIASFLVALAPATIFKRYMEFEGQDYLRTRKAPSLKTTGLVLVLLALSIIAANFLIYANGLLDATSVVGSSAGEAINQAQEASFRSQIILLTEPSTWFFLLNIGCYAVLAGIGEELFYRGVVQRLFIKMLRNPHAAIVITAVIFSLMHADYYAFLPRVFMGVVLGYIYLCTGNIWYGVIFHFINNALPVSFYWLTNYGLDISDVSTVLNFGTSGVGRWVGLALLVGFIFFAITQLNKYIRRDFLQEIKEY